MPVVTAVRRHVRALVTAVLAGGLLSPLACASQGVGRYDRQQLAATLTAPASTSGLVVGEFRLKTPGIVDGDTIKVEGLDGSLRLLGIDTEETFKSEADRRAYALGFEHYWAKKQAGRRSPAKVATPLGMDAKVWAEEFFQGVRVVRIERDHPKELRDRYNRVLAYVLVEKDGRWLNYNVECVRAGMSPYFTKYGYSRRFHAELVEAQAEAQAAQRGIWDPTREHYPDYELRLRWWNARAEEVARFEREAEGREDWINLTHWDALDRLAALEGEEVVVFSTVGDIRPRQGKRPARVMLSRRMFSDLPLVFFDDEVFARSRIEDAEYVQVRGTVSRYVFSTRRSRSRKKDEPPPSQLQIQIRRPEQITFVDTRPGHLAHPGVPTPEAHDEPAHDEPSHDEPSHDEPAHDEPSHDEPSRDEPAHDEPSQDEPSHAAPSVPSVPPVPPVASRGSP
jgi:endonuclease YncB( thermonuclease family)